MGRLRHAAHERRRCVRGGRARLSLSGDDFAEYLLQTKGAYAYLGTANPKKPHTCISNHRGDFDIDEETLPLGAALYAAYALSVLDPQFAK